MAACSKDTPFSPDREDPSPLPAGTFAIFTRSEETPTNYNLPAGFSQPQDIQINERIHNWVVIFIKDNKIEEVCSGEVTPSDDNPTDKYTFKPEMPDGTYDIVAFANLPMTKVAELVVGSTENISKFDDLEGKTANLADTYIIANNAFVNGSTDEKDRIPMSGFRNGVKIAGNQEVGGSEKDRNYIEVIRMVAKVELKFLNSNANKQIQFDKITFGMLQTEATVIKPDYEKLNSNSKAETLGAISTNPTSVEISSDKFDLKVLGNEGINELDVIFYVRESDASLTQPATGKFMLSFGMLEEDKTDKVQHYAVTDELQWINRNDHIVIPVRLQDYIIDWKVLYYPPIGGYPAVIEEKDPYNFYYYCDFKTPGEFQIIPDIYNPDGSPTNLKYDLTVGEATPTLDSGQSGNFFTTPPTISINGDEIVGSVGTVLGSAVVPVTIKIGEESETNTPITRTRNIYIRRSQASQ